uniref:PH01B031C15.7 protein n=1 Tax=Phyllostachys edulis TaxID=38705 RepID=L0P1S8_PHYED|nr:PH01B031C15.7 [Phyllostachys edulis]
MALHRCPPPPVVLGLLLLSSAPMSSTSPFPSVANTTILLCCANVIYSTTTRHGKHLPIKLGYNVKEKLLDRHAMLQTPSLTFRGWRARNLGTPLEYPRKWMTTAESGVFALSHRGKFASHAHTPRRVADPTLGHSLARYKIRLDTIVSRRVTTAANAMSMAESRGPSNMIKDAAFVSIFVLYP